MIHGTIKEVRKCCDSTESDESIKLLTLLHHLGYGNLSLCSWKTLSAGMSAIVTCTEPQYEFTLSGALFYILDGFLPMVKTCCQKLEAWNKPNQNCDPVKLLLIKELKYVAEGVVVSVDTLHTF